MSSLVWRCRLLCVPWGRSCRCLALWAVPPICHHGPRLPWGPIPALPLVQSAISLDSAQCEVTGHLTRGFQLETQICLCSRMAELYPSWWPHSTACPQSCSLGPWVFEHVTLVCDDLRMWWMPQGWGWGGVWFDAARILSSIVCKLETCPGGLYIPCHGVGTPVAWEVLGDKAISLSLSC